jgi:uncharacterized protein YqiB (DUF1249 family)
MKMRGWVSQFVLILMEVTDKTDVLALERHLMQLEAAHAKESKKYAVKLKEMKLQLDVTEHRKNELT